MKKRELRALLEAREARIAALAEAVRSLQRQLAEKTRGGDANAAASEPAAESYNPEGFDGVITIRLDPRALVGTEPPDGRLVFRAKGPVR